MNKVACHTIEFYLALGMKSIHHKSELICSHIRIKPGEVGRAPSWAIIIESCLTLHVTLVELCDASR